MTYKLRAYACGQCEHRVQALAWNTDPSPQCEAHGAMYETDPTLAVGRNLGVIDDQLEGGARWCETIGHEPVWLDGSKSQYNRVVNQHNVVNVVRHDASYYAAKRREHMEFLRDTRQIRES